MSVYFGNNSNSVSTLFSSLSGSSSSGLSSMLSDYNSIRSGSYKKLLTSYYDKFGTDRGKKSTAYSIDNKNDKTSEYSYTSYLTSKDSASTLSKIGSSSSALAKSATAIMRGGSDSVFNEKDIKAEDGTVTRGYDRDAIYKAVSSFVDNYNSTVKAASVSAVDTIKKSYNSMLSATSANSNLLSQIGVTINDDNTLTIDKDRLSSASVSDMKSLFSSSGSYASSIQSTASRINSYAEYETEKLNTYGTKRAVKTSSSKASNSAYLTTADATSTLSNIKSSTNELTNSIATVLQRGTKSVFAQKDIKAADGTVSRGYDRDTIYNAISSFVKNYNSTVSSAANSSVGTIKKAYESILSATSVNAKQLDKIGISVNEKDNTLSIDKDKLNSADISAVKSLFNSSGSYAYSISSSVSQMNAYATYEAGRTNTYTGAATYTGYASIGNIYDSLF